MTPPRHVFARVSFLAIPALTLAAACGEEPAPGRGAFDAGLADSLVARQVAFGPRVPGSEAHAAALEWMTAYLRERADTVEQMPFTHVTAHGDTLRLANVWARFQPAATQRILLTAHWDSRPVSERAADPFARADPLPGANDGASGVAVLLALADELAEMPPAVGVDILLTDGEDWGHDPESFATEVEDMLLGARHFASTHSDYRPLFGILLDMVGERDARFTQEQNSLALAPEVVRRVWDMAEDLGYGEFFPERIGPAVNDDHVVLNEAGIRTIDIIDFDYPYWHTPEDTPDKVDAETLGAVGDVLLALIRRLGGQT
ncbi:MAG TPA: M28 family peptidase [Gemmatimonadota bacterium]|nr:M28 family peptidase [Gemmatimonadota bacterium]